MRMSTSPKGYSLFLKDLDRILDCSRRDMLSLKGCSLFLTGCTAFIGKWLMESLLWANQQLTLGLRLTVLTRSPTSFLDAMPHLAAHKSLSLVQGSILCLPGPDIPRCDLAIHGVNLPNDARTSWPARHMLTVVSGTEALMNMAARKGCRHILLLSSGAVYGSPLSQKTPFAEDALPVDLHEPAVYGNTKRFVESYARAKGQELGIAISIARCFAFIGAYMPLNERNAMSSFLLHALRRQPITIQGDGTPLRSFLSGRDLSIWLLAMLSRGNGRVYNVGSRHVFPLRKWAQKVLTCAELPEDFLVVQGKALRGNAPDVYVPDTSLARNALQLAETASPEENIMTTLNWFREHPACIPAVSEHLDKSALA